MPDMPSERLLPANRLTRAADYARPGGRGVAFRGRCCLLMALAAAGETSRVGFIASRRGVGGAVQRNRARRRLREIVRRRWTRVPPEGYLLVFIASRRTLDAPHQVLATDVETLLAHAGALAPSRGGGPASPAPPPPPPHPPLPPPRPPPGARPLPPLPLLFRVRVRGHRAPRHVARRLARAPPARPLPPARDRG